VGNWAARLEGLAAFDFLGAIATGDECRNRYNRGALRHSLIQSFCRFLFLFIAAGPFSGIAAGQAIPGTQSVMVMPFENQSSAPGLEWISEAFPQVFSQRMASPKLYVISRDDRLYAFDRVGIPATVHPSRATIYHIAELMDVDYVVMGSYEYDGTQFSASAQLLDMKKLHLFPAAQSSGALTNLIDVQTVLAWELLEKLPARPATTREEFLKASPPIRLDAFESYIRGVMAAGHQQKVRYFHNALKLNPGYTLAMIQLGKTYYDAHEYESAALWFGRVPKDDSAAGEASFLLGMSEFYRGNFEKAFSAFNSLSARLPLTEVYNNMGVVEARRGRRAAAVEYFSKAVNADPNDADYRFNLGVALFKNGDTAGAMRELRDELQQRPTDGEAKSFLEMINRGAAPPPAPSTSPTPAGNALLSANQPRIPLERIKRNYDEESYRQLEMEIHNLTEARLAKTDRHTHSAYDVERGKELLAQNQPEQAEREFRNAISADYGNAIAHAQLAVLLEKKGDVTNALAEAQTSIRLQPNVDAFLVLARIDLKKNLFQSAAGDVDRALALEPANAAALALKKDITAQQTVSK
jgi:tetratricopeptide (TPR) repeat protein